MGSTTQVRAALEAVAPIERIAKRADPEGDYAVAVHRLARIRTLAREAIAQLTAIVEPQHEVKK